MASRRRRAPDKRQRGGGRDDDRPRGYEPMRMRRLWDDIDQSRDKLGLGQGHADRNGAAWPWDAWFEWASGVIGEATTLPGQVRTALEQAPGVQTCRAVTDGAFDLARRLPIVGGLVPRPSPRPPDQDDPA